MIDGDGYISERGHVSLDHIHLWFLEPGHYSPLLCEKIALVEERQSGHVLPQKQQKMSLEGSSKLLGNGLVWVALGSLKQVEVVERSRGGLRGLVPNSSLKRGGEEREREHSTKAFWFTCGPAFGSI